MTASFARRNPIRMPPRTGTSRSSESELGTALKGNQSGELEPTSELHQAEAGLNFCPPPPVWLRAHAPGPRLVGGILERAGPQRVPQRPRAPEGLQGRRPPSLQPPARARARAPEDDLLPSIGDRGAERRTFLRGQVDALAAEASRLDRDSRELGERAVEAERLCGGVGGRHRPLGPRPIRS